MAEPRSGPNGGYNNAGCTLEFALNGRQCAQRRVRILYLAGGRGTRAQARGRYCSTPIPAMPSAHAMGGRNSSRLRRKKLRRRTDACLGRVKTAAVAKGRPVALATYTQRAISERGIWMSLFVCFFFSCRDRSPTPRDTTCDCDEGDVYPDTHAQNAGTRTHLTVRVQTEPGTALATRSELLSTRSCCH